jgi:hypothetical protein
MQDTDETPDSGDTISKERPTEPAPATRSRKRSLAHDEPSRELPQAASEKQVLKKQPVDIIEIDDDDYEEEVADVAKRPKK